MGRREDDARLAGMMYAYKQIKEHGLDHGLRYGYDGCDAEELKAKVTEALPALCDNDLAACVQEDSADEQ